MRRLGEHRDGSIVHAIMAGLLMTTVAVAEPARPSSAGPAALEGVTFDQRVGGQVDPDLRFRDTRGAAVDLGRYLGSSVPVVLAMGYYECPMLCTLVFSGVVQALDQAPLVPGEDYEVVIVSVDPAEGPKLAATVKRRYLSLQDRTDAEDHYHFLTGREDQVAALARSVGFNYRYDLETDQYAHPAGLVVLDPQGRISSYVTGVHPDPEQLATAVATAAAGGTVEAEEGVGSLLLRCFQYDPSATATGWWVMAGVRGAGVMTLLAMAGGLAWMIRQPGAGGEEA